MNRELGNRLYVDALFYDALSGEFTPPTDNQRRHTLGRLACAVFTKGEYNINDDETFPTLVSTYSPSWAKHILARAHINFVDLNGQFPPTLYAIELNDSANNRLRVTTTNDSLVSVQLGENTVEVEHELELGARLEQARTAITGTTQRFFDQAVML